MCKKLDDLVKEETKKAEDRGRTEGLVEGMTKGKFEATLTFIRKLISNKDMSVEEAIEFVDVPKNERYLYYQ